MLAIQNTPKAIKKDSHKSFWFSLFFLLGLIFVRYGLQVNFPRELLLPMAFVMACRGNLDEILALCACCIPLHSSLQYAYVVLMCLVVLIFKYYEHIKLNITFIPIIMIVLWELLHCFDEFFSPVRLVHILLPFAFYLILLSFDNLKFDYGFIVRAFSVTMIGTCIMLIGKLLFVANFDWYSAIYALRRLGHNITEMEVEGGEIQPNTLGIICVLAMTGLLQLRISKQGKQSDLWMTLSLILFGILTSSRTFLVCLLIMVVCLLFAQPDGMKENIKLLLAISGVVFVAIVMMMLFFPDMLTYYFGRFQEEDITTGRGDVMLFYHDLIVSEPVLFSFGIGAVNFRKELLSKYIVPHVPHNGIQELIIAWGLPGVILFTALLFSMVWRARVVVKKQRLIHYIPLIVLLVKIQAGQMLTSAYTMIAFIYAYLSMCNHFENGGYCPRCNNSNSLM